MNKRTLVGLIVALAVLAPLTVRLAQRLWDRFFVAAPEISLQEPGDQDRRQDKSPAISSNGSARGTDEEETKRIQALLNAFGEILQHPDGNRLASYFDEKRLYEA